MSKKDFWLFNIVFIVIFVFGLSLSFNVFSNDSFSGFIKYNFRNALESEESHSNLNLTNCSSIETVDLNNSVGEELRKLAEYQDICGSFVTNTMMYFTLVPSNSTLEDILRKDIDRLQEFQSYGIKPTIILEPYTSDGLMKWTDISTGVYDGALKAYFEELKEKGITSSDIEMIVPLPEANVPSWGVENGNPNDFGPAFNRIIQIARESFPEVESSVLFNSQSYDATDVNWENGRYASYNEYLAGIPEGTIDRLGIQGFPWQSSADRRAITLFDPQEFLAPDLAVSTADDLEIRKIWFNTGTYTTKYSGNEEREVRMDISTRKKILSDITLLSEQVADKGYEVRVFIFAEDKARTVEATDWSYSTSGEKLLIRDFVTEMNQKQLEVGIADK